MKLLPILFLSLSLGLIANIATAGYASDSSEDRSYKQWSKFAQKYPAQNKLLSKKDNAILIRDNQKQYALPALACASDPQKKFAFAPSYYNERSGFLYFMAQRAPQECNIETPSAAYDFRTHQFFAYAGNPSFSPDGQYLALFQGKESLCPDKLTIWHYQNNQWSLADTIDKATLFNDPWGHAPMQLGHFDVCYEDMYWKDGSLILDGIPMDPKNSGSPYENYALNKSDIILTTADLLTDTGSAILPISLSVIIQPITHKALPVWPWQYRGDERNIEATEAALSLEINTSSPLRIHRLFEVNPQGEPTTSLLIRKADVPAAGTDVRNHDVDEVARIGGYHITNFSEKFGLIELSQDHDPNGNSALFDLETYRMTPVSGHILAFSSSGKTFLTAPKPGFFLYDTHRLEVWEKDGMEWEKLGEYPLGSFGKRNLLVKDATFINDDTVEVSFRLPGSTSTTSPDSVVRLQRTVNKGMSRFTVQQ